MLSNEYLWPVPELTLVYKAYKLASFQEPVTYVAIWKDPIPQEFVSIVPLNKVPLVIDKLDRLVLVIVVIIGII
jgi:hypothetical protein